MNTSPEPPTSDAAISEVLRAHRAQLMAAPNVVGVGVGYRQACGIRTDTMSIVVLVSRKLPAEQLLPGALLPTELGGFPVDVQEVGELSIQS